MAAVPSFPYLENDTLAHFVYRGSANYVNVPGDANEWNVNGSPMTRLSTTDLYYFTKSFESDARLEYKFYINGLWMVDPRNPRTAPGTFWNS